MLKGLSRSLALYVFTAFKAKLKFENNDMCQFKNSLDIYDCLCFFLVI